MNTPHDPGQQDQSHVPVLADEAVHALDPHPGGTFVDGTFGGGGHARIIAERLEPDGRLLCFDRDFSASERFDQLARESSAVVEFVHGSYASLPEALSRRGLAGVDGILLDLGLSSLQLGDPERGFSFSGDGPLDMRYDRSTGRTAADAVNTATEDELVEMLFKYGEERSARRIARAIVRQREHERFESTRQLANLVERTIGRPPGSRIHPATRTFQALRIAVNDELGELEQGLLAGIDALNPGGRFVVISFHSLEDRIVKQTFNQEVRGCICPPDIPVCVCGRTPRLRLVGKPVKPDAAETAANPRARSAIMRVAERLS